MKRNLNWIHFHNSQILIFTLMSFISVSGAFQANAENIQSLEKRSCIQSVDGYSYLSEDKTIADLRASAMKNAKQQALTNASTYIRSRTEVENFVLKSDEVLINAEGTVKILEQQDHGIQDNSRYHIWIKAEVEYLLGADSSSETAAMDHSSAPPTSTKLSSEPTRPDLPSATAPLTVRVWSPKKSYNKGEKIVVYLEGNRDFYARVVDVNSEGDIVQLLPNNYRTSSFFKGNTKYNIPNEEDKFELTVSPPYGTDRIVVYASEVPLGDVQTTPIGQGLSLFAGTQDTLGTRTRGIAITAKQDTEPGSTPAIAEFFETSYEITTSP